MSGVRWGKDEKPLINNWYRVIGTKDKDYWKIMKDYHNPLRGVTYWKIVSFYEGEPVVVGKALAYCRMLMKEGTYKCSYQKEGNEK